MRNHVIFVVDHVIFVVSLVTRAVQDKSPPEWELRDSCFNVHSLYIEF